MPMIVALATAMPIRPDVLMHGHPKVPFDSAGVALPPSSLWEVPPDVNEVITLPASAWFHPERTISTVSDAGKPQRSSLLP
jgi:hypothetical protein